ncbi:MAG: hypothetical protein ACOCRO_09255 [Halanaerobiales bacterium]
MAFSNINIEDIKRIEDTNVALYVERAMTSMQKLIQSVEYTVNELKEKNKLEETTMEQFKKQVCRNKETFTKEVLDESDKILKFSKKDLLIAIAYAIKAEGYFYNEYISGYFCEEHKYNYKNCINYLKKTYEIGKKLTEEKSLDTSSIFKQIEEFFDLLSEERNERFEIIKPLSSYLYNVTRVMFTGVMFLSEEDFYSTIIDDLKKLNGVSIDELINSLEIIEKNYKTLFYANEVVEYDILLDIKKSAISQKKEGKTTYSVKGSAKYKELRYKYVGSQKSKPNVSGSGCIFPVISFILLISLTVVLI